MGEVEPSVGVQFSSSNLSLPLNFFKRSESSVLLLLLSYHRRLRMISEALELRVKADELITVDACVQVVMAMVGWVRAVIEIVVVRHAGQRWDGLVACWEMPEHIQIAR